MVTLKNLWCGKITIESGKTVYDLYTVPSLKAAIIRSIAVNYEAGVSTRLQVNFSGTVVSLAPDSTTASLAFYSDMITLGAGDKIQINFFGTLPGSPSTAVCISGIERDI